MKGKKHTPDQVIAKLAEGVSGHLKLHSGGQIIARWRTPKLHGIGGVLGAGTWGG